ncbi:hypothetical protein [Lysinibacillus sp. NPDC059133]|uniref:hypothetical protein n=1 Tax=Lysinibacillus sp. NPDC059133 TaxID=3346737 RepID=UPI00369FED77
MNFFELLSGINIKSLVPFASIAPFLIVMLKLGVDSFNLKAVEKVFMVPSKRLLIFFSQILIISFVLFLSFYTFYGLPNDFKKVQIIGLAIISIISTLIIFIIVFPLFNVLSVKFKFSFIDSEHEWEIEKRINKNRVLTSRDNEFFKHFEINSVLDKELKIIMVKKYLPGHKFINTSFILIIFALICIMSFSLVIIWKSMNVEGLFYKVLFGIVLLICYLSYIYATCIKINENLMRKYSKKEK